MAERTGLEPATPGVTGRYSNQLNYRSALVRPKSKLKAWRCPTLTWGNPTLPSALFRFTSEFGMESGGSKTLWSPSKFFNSESCFCVLYTFNSVLALSPSKPLGCCMVKPHGQLVSVSSMPHSTYTPDLSTS
ncbi:conserved hypothetical protein [Vibrio parahaemolyticus AQ3810]|nr:conserved hypothetical protein [Vibrio parahaemolyticus AQ3810]